MWFLWLVGHDLDLFLCTYAPISPSPSPPTTSSPQTAPPQSLSLDRQQCTISTRGRRTKEPTQTLKPRRSLSCSTSPCCFRFPFLHNNFTGIIRRQSLLIANMEVFLTQSAMGPGRALEDKPSARLKNIETFEVRF